jgi:hypothetical protein
MGSLCQREREEGESSCDNPVISFMDIRPSVKSMCLLWC